MTIKKDLIQKLEAQNQSLRGDSIVQSVAAIVFSEMRFDPYNPKWPGGDKLAVSESYRELIVSAFQQLGCAEANIPTIEPSQAGSIQSPRRVFLFSDGSNLPSSCSSNAIVIAAGTPPNELQWAIQDISGLSADAIQSAIQNHPKQSSKPLWLQTSESKSQVTVSAASTQTSAIGNTLPPLSDRMSRLGTETAFSVLAEVNQLRSQGRDIVSFGLGEPDFDTPPHVKEAGKNAIDENFTHYGPSNGLPDLRASIAKYMERTRHIPVHPDEVVVTPGAKPIIFDVIMSLINPGDEVLYPNPGYPIYESVIEWVGAKAVPLPLTEESGWEFRVADLESRITPKTKMIVLNSPSNPTGGSIGLETNRVIARIALENNLWIVSDEVYSQIVFDIEHHSVASLPGMKERTIIVDGFSKTYAMTGWRLGYGVMNRDLAQQAAKIETNIDSCTCTFSQMAAVRALDGPQDESEFMIGQFKQRGQAITDLLNDIEGVSCVAPKGAFYVFPNVTGACQRLGMANANELQRALLYDAGVALLPRTCFGRRNEGEDQEYLRLSYATSMELIQEGIRRMKEFIERS